MIISNSLPERLLNLYANNYFESPMESMYTYDRTALNKLLITIIKRYISIEAWAWIIEDRSSFNFIAFNSAFAATPRKTGKAVIEISHEENATIQKIRPGLNITNWSVDRLCRVWLLVNLDASEKQTYFTAIERLFLAAEMNEMVALYSSLPVLAYPGLWRKRCTEGIRSNIGDVLQTIICNNPYPSEQLDENAWNQLVLKAFFTEKPVDQINNLDERANKELANTLSDYAHERWAAGRAVNPLLWRSVGRFINESIFPDIKRIANSENSVDRQAAALACWNSNFEPAKKLLDKNLDLRSAIEKGELTWDTVAEKVNN